MPKKKEKSFEESMLRLNEIISEIEDGETCLERAMELYKEGVGLSLLCAQKLSAAESEIAVLTKSLDGFIEMPYVR